MSLKTTHVTYTCVSVFVDFVTSMAHLHDANVNWGEPDSVPFKAKMSCKHGYIGHANIKEVRCYEAKIEESEKGRQPPGVEPRTPLA